MADRQKTARKTAELPANGQLAAGESALWHRAGNHPPRPVLLMKESKSKARFLVLDLVNSTPRKLVTTYVSKDRLTWHTAWTVTK